MKRFGIKITIASILIVGLTGCGGGGESSASSTTYDMWDYLVSQTTITKNFDSYDTDSNYNPNGASNLDSSQEKHTIISSDSVNVKMTSGATIVNNDTLTVHTSTISSDDGSSANRFVNIGSTWGACTVSEYLNTYTPYVGYNYSNILKLQCGDMARFYEKGKGLVVDQIHNSTSTQFRIIVKNNN